MKQLGMFLVVGFFNTGLGYCVIFSCMYLFGMSPELSNIAGYGTGLVASYVLNRKFTFGSTRPYRPEIIRFVMVFLVSYGFNYLALILLIYELQVDKGISQLLAGVVYVIFSFFMNKLYVFKVASSK